jgi:hypothetical protein
MQGEKIAVFVLLFTGKTHLCLLHLKTINTKIQRIHSSMHREGGSE